MRRRTRPTLPVLVFVLLISSGSGWAGMIEGGVAYEVGDYERAAEHFRRVVEADPIAAYAHMLLGRSMDHLGQPEQALGHLNRARELLPHDPDILHSLSLHYSSAGAWAEAAIFAGKALQQAPQRAELISLAAWTSLEAGDDERAVSLLSRIADPSMDTVVALTLANLRLQRHENAFDGLVHVLDPARESSPTTGELVREYTHWLLAQSCVPSQDSYRTLEEHLFDAWSRDVRAGESERHLVGLWRGIVAIKRRDPERALEHLESVLKSVPDSCAGRYYQALAFGQMGRQGPNGGTDPCRAPDGPAAESDLPALDPRDLTPLAITVREHARTMQNRPEEPVPSSQ